MLTGTNDDDLKWMQRSIDLAGQCKSDDGLFKPKVGVVIVRYGQLLGESYRGETGSGRHAEFGLVEKLGITNLAGSTVFTTLEPCSRRNPPKLPCAHHLIEARVSTVFIGMFDPNPRIYCEGWALLRNADIKLRSYPDHLRERIKAENKQFVDSFKISVGPRGSASFDYTQNGGFYCLEDEAIVINTQWSTKGHTSIHAINHDQHVALARYARDFSEIDNPGAYDWSNYSVGVSVGEIVMFRAADAYALIKITDVNAGPQYGHDHFAVSFDYKLRLRS